MVAQELLELIVCPACRGTLVLEVAAAGAESGREAANESLRCAGCGRVYPVENDIPVLLVDRAKMPE